MYPRAISAALRARGRKGIIITRDFHANLVNSLIARVAGYGIANNRNDRAQYVTDVPAFILQRHV